MSRNKKARPSQIRALMEKTGKRARGAANIVSREQAARQRQHQGTPPAAPPTRLPGDLTPLTFTCLLCRTPRDLPLRDFASGTILCPHHDPPRQFAVPDNGRYRRLAREIETLNARHNDVTMGLVAVNTEPYLVLCRPPRVEVAHAETWETRVVAVGHWNGPGNMLGWENPLNANIGAAVLLWLEKNARSAA
jgi:hypothetical protein